MKQFSQLIFMSCMLVLLLAGFTTIVGAKDSIKATTITCSFKKCVSVGSTEVGAQHALRGNIQVREVVKSVWDTKGIVPLTDVAATSSDCPQGAFPLQKDDWLFIETDDPGKNPILRIWFSQPKILVTAELSVRDNTSATGYETWRGTTLATQYGDYDYFVYLYDSNSGLLPMNKVYGLDIFPPKNMASDKCNAERPDDTRSWKMVGTHQIHSGQGGEPDHP